MSHTLLERVIFVRFTLSVSWSAALGSTILFFVRWLFNANFAHALWLLIFFYCWVYVEWRLIRLNHMWNLQEWFLSWPCLVQSLDAIALHSLRCNIDILFFSTTSPIAMTLHVVRARNQSLARLCLHRLPMIDSQRLRILVKVTLFIKRGQSGAWTSFILHYRHAFRLLCVLRRVDF